MTSSLVLAILKLQHEKVRISVQNRLMSKISSYDKLAIQKYMFSSWRQNGSFRFLASSEFLWASIGRKWMLHWN